MIDLSDVLLYLRPDAQWSVTGNQYSGINWEGPGEKPTEQEINNAWSDAEVYWKRKEASLSRANFKLGLLDIGELDAVKQFIEQTNDQRIIIMWEDSSRFRRTHPDLLRLASEMGYTDEQLDALFGVTDD